MVVNKRVVANRFRKNRDSYDRNARVQLFIADKLSDEAKNYVGCNLNRVLEIGCGTGLLTKQLLEWLPKESLMLNDLVQEMCISTAESVGIDNDKLYPGDAEKIEFPGNLDLIVSSSVFQWLENPKVCMERFASLLRDGGFLVFSSFGSENLKELRVATNGQGLSYLDIAEWQNILSPNFKILHTFSHTDCCYFDSPLAILQHLKLTGANGSQDSRAWTKGDLERFAAAYEVFRTPNGFPLTYHPILFVCCKKSL